MKGFDFVRKILEGLDSAIGGVREIVGKGEVNHAFVVEVSGERWVVRFPRDPRDQGDFGKEAWCLTAAAEAGIPTPRLVETGATDGVPWIVQNFVEGDTPVHDAWSTFGDYARRLAEVPLDGAPDALFSRFGRDLARSWKLHLNYNAESLVKGDSLVGHGVYRDAGPIRDSIARLRALDEFGFFHGDLAPGNAIRSGDRLVLIDWGSAGTGPVPYTELLNVWSRFSTIEAMAFAEGIGVDLPFAVPILRDLRLLGAIDLVRWAIDRRPDRFESCVQAARTVVNEFIAPSIREAS